MAWRDFESVWKPFPRRAAKVNTVRVCQDGNFVFAHTEYNIGGPKVGFDFPI
jgi:predicted SnoaL-like aldol condensation-catalyzing enzyme